MRGKGQSAVEFIVTYGWMILLVVLVLFILFNFGIITIGGTPAPVISGFSGITVAGAVANTTTFEVQLVNNVNQPINISMVVLSAYGNTYPEYLCNFAGETTSNELYPGQSIVCIFLGSFQNSQTRATLSVSYSESSITNINQTASGRIVLVPSKNPIPVDIRTTLTNVTITSETTTPATTQQEVVFSPSDFIGSLYPDLGNIRFYNGSQLLNSWCESGCNTSAKTSVFWIKLTHSIPANRSTLIQMVFLPIGTYNGIGQGEAAQWSNPFGIYDNIANVMDSGALYQIYYYSGGTCDNTNYEGQIYAEPISNTTSINTCAQFSASTPPFYTTLSGFTGSVDGTLENDVILNYQNGYTGGVAYPNPPVSNPSNSWILKLIGFVKTNGTTKFYGLGDDGIAMSYNNTAYSPFSYRWLSSLQNLNNVFSGWKTQAATEYSGAVNLSGDYRIELNYFEDGGDSYTALWSNHSVTYFGVTPTRNGVPVVSAVNSQIQVFAPVGIINYMPIVISNLQNSSTTNPFQQSVTIDPSLYQEYEAINLQNLEFFYINGTIIPSWLSSGQYSTSSSATFWLKLSGLNAFSSMVIYLGFGKITTNFFNGVDVGEYAGFSTPYGKYDDGSDVFQYYTNFGGTSLPNGWTASGSPNYKINNGITFNPGGSGGSDGCTSSLTIPQNLTAAVIYFYGEINGTISTNPCNRGGIGFTAAGAVHNGSLIGTLNDTFGVFNAGVLDENASMTKLFGAYSLYSLAYSGKTALASEPGDSAEINFAGGESPIGFSSQHNGTITVKAGWLALTTYPPNGENPKQTFTNANITRTLQLFIDGVTYRNVTGTNSTDQNFTVYSNETNAIVRLYVNGALLAGPSRKIATYIAALPVGNYRISASSNITGTGNITFWDVVVPAPSQVAFVEPLSVINSQALPVPVNFSLRLNISSAYFDNVMNLSGKYAFQNVEFFNSTNGDILPSWLESYTSKYALFWIYLKNGIPPSFTLNDIEIGIATNTTNLLNNKKVGEAPTLSKVYGQYDDGADVFLYYDNFSGTTVKSVYTKDTNGGNTVIKQNNKINITTGNVATGGGLILTTPFTPPVIFEADVIGIGLFPPGVPPVITGIMTQTGASDTALGYCFVFWYASVCSMKNTAGTSVGLNESITKGVEGLAWVSSSSQVFYNNYTNDFRHATQLTLPANVYMSIGQFYENSTANAGDSYTTYQWIRVRAYPPNGIAPTTEVRALFKLNGLL